jgi:hypothetical protein
MLNLWGEFVGRSNGQDFKPVPNPRGVDAQAIVDANQDAIGFHDESAPLTIETLAKFSDSMSHLPGQFEWLYVSFWFGLRPSEMDQLKDSRLFQILPGAEGTSVLRVYQPKFVSVGRDMRWKAIPIFTHQQMIALEFIKRSDLRRPLTKTVKHYSGDPYLTLYGGRKAFTNLMLDHGQKLEDIAMWLGHRSIETIWKHYKQKTKVSFTKLPLNGGSADGSRRDKAKPSHMMHRLQT